jgi:hypothetical protein
MGSLVRCLKKRAKHKTIPAKRLKFGNRRFRQHKTHWRARFMCSRAITCDIFLVVFSFKKVKSEMKPPQERRTRTQQVHFGQNGTLFGRASFSPNVEMKMSELLGHPAYLLLLPSPLPSLESLLSPSASAGLASSFTSNCAKFLLSRGTENEA